MINKIRKALGGNESDKTLAVLGLSFKPETDDMREAPSLSILPKLIDNGASIHAHDPKGMDEAKTLLPDSIVYYNDIYQTLEDVDAVVLMTEWNAYRGLDLKRVLNTMHGKVFIDLRNVYEPEQMKNAGFDYYCIGR